MLRPLAILLCLAATAVAGSRVRDPYGYDKLASKPTPPSWHAGAVWRFTTISHGKANNLTFRVTDEAATICTSGTWHKLVVLSGKVGSGSEPAYSVEGRFLWISLNANICDANDDIRGALGENTFKGDRRAGGMFGSTRVGKVVGSPVQP
jgi:hypothetical protein